MAQEFATAINCIDGRAQKPVLEYMQKNFGVEYVDMITEPGPNKILSQAQEIDTIERLNKKVKISVEKHNSQIIAIVAHYDCAANPESEDMQKKDLRNAVKIIASWKFPVNICALWLDENFSPSVIS